MIFIGKCRIFVFLLILAKFTKFAICENFKNGDLHSHMTKNELGYFFSVSDAKLVSLESYQVVEIHHSEVSRSMQKRSGLDHDATTKFEVFGKSFNFNLKQNKNLLVKNAGIVVNEKDNSSRRFLAENFDTSCHFISTGSHPERIAALSFCDGSYRGYFTDDTKVYDVMPLHPRLHQIVSGESYSKYHIVKLVEGEKPKTPKFNDEDDIMLDDEVYRSNPNLKIDWKVASEKRNGKPTKQADKANFNGKRTKRTDKPELIVETSVFLDCTGYDLYREFYDAPTQQEITKNYVYLILTVMNGVQGIYNYPELGRKVTFAIQHIELHKKCFFDDEDGLRSEFLDSFCKYQKGKLDDGYHWDIALLFSGTDMRSVTPYESTGTMGLAPVSAICDPSYGCVIGEIGVVDDNDRPYPSTGFLSIVVMAHEIGHNFGMDHDSTSNDCPEQGFIMSPSRGLTAENKWSQCSIDVIQNFNDPCLLNEPAEIAISHNKYRNNPGLLIKADEQCQFLMRDFDASLLIPNGESLPDICNSLLCESPNESRPFSAGPALDGTFCGTGMRCFRGECVERDLSNDGDDEPETWSSWNEGPCEGGCIRGNKGVRKRSRECRNKSKDCIAPSQALEVCSQPDTDRCSYFYENADDYATDQCKDFRDVDDGNNLSGQGKQMPFDADSPGKSCIIHCEQARNVFFASAVDLNIGTLSPYFPDGTSCKEDGSFLCMEGVCVDPRDVRSGKGGRRNPNNILIADGYNTPKGSKVFNTDSKGRPRDRGYRGTNKSFNPRKHTQFPID